MTKKMQNNGGTKDESGLKLMGILIARKPLNYTMEKDGSQLSFPQRHWLLLCVLIAILSPLLVHWIQAGTTQVKYQDAVHQKPLNHGGASPDDTGKQGSNTMTPANGKQVQDTSYKISAPPQHK